MINEVVPLLAVNNLQESLRFYVDGIGFEIKLTWEDEGVLRWCRIQLDGAGLMLQQLRTDGHDSRTFSDNKGEGVRFCFFCDDAVELYHALKSRGLNPSEPVVSNGLWYTTLTDPDGYYIDFESPTDVPEHTRLSSLQGKGTPDKQRKGNA